MCLPETFHFDADEEGVCFSLVGRDGDELPGFMGPPWAAWVQMGRVGMAEDSVKHFKDAVDKERKLLRLHFDATGKRLLKVVGEHGNDCLPDKAHRRLIEANLEEVRCSIMLSTSQGVAGCTISRGTLTTHRTISSFLHTWRNAKMMKSDRIHCTKASEHESCYMV